MGFMGRNLFLDGRNGVERGACGDMLWSALNNALSPLGESSKRAILSYLNRRGINSNTIDKDCLLNALNTLLGNASAPILLELDKKITDR